MRREFGGRTQGSAHVHSTELGAIAGLLFGYLHTGHGRARRSESSARHEAGPVLAMPAHGHRAGPTGYRQKPGLTGTGPV